jgi:hypothetical protein
MNYQLEPQYNLNILELNLNNFNILKKELINDIKTKKIINKSDSERYTSINNLFHFKNKINNQYYKDLLYEIENYEMKYFQSLRILTNYVVNRIKNNSILKECNETNVIHLSNISSPLLRQNAIHIDSYSNYSLKDNIFNIINTIYVHLTQEKYVRKLLNKYLESDLKKLKYNERIIDILQKKTLDENKKKAFYIINQNNYLDIQKLKQEIFENKNM